MTDSARAQGGVTVLMPSGFRDPLRPSGGNNYDAHLLDGLRRDGWQLTEATTPDPGPEPDQTALERLDATLAGIPDGALVLADGLVTTAAAAVVVPHSRRLVVVVVLHLPRSLPLDGRAARAPHGVISDSERRVLAAAAGVIATSRWTASWIAEQPGLADASVTVASPGAEPAPRAVGAPAGSEAGPNLLFLGRLATHKGVDVLAHALGMLADVPWQCWCVGPADDLAVMADVRRTIERANLSTRVHLTGALTGAALADRMHATDLLLVPSRFETYGMVITEALARGIPVVATDVGGIGEALGSDREGRRPGRLIPPDNPAALAAAVHAWLTGPSLRRLWRETAYRRRDELGDWSRTARLVAGALITARRRPHDREAQR